MANPPAPRITQPPVIPQLPRADPGLADYLKSFALWCQNGFLARAPSNAALPYVYLQAFDTAPGSPPKVFKVQVDHTGTLVITPAPLGSGFP